MCWCSTHWSGPCRGVLKNAPSAGFHFGFGFGFGFGFPSVVLVPVFDPEPVVAWLGTVDTVVRTSAAISAAMSTSRRFTVRVLPDSRDPDLRDQPPNKPGNANTATADFHALGRRWFLAGQIAHPRHQVGDHLDGDVELLGVGHVARLSAVVHVRPRLEEGDVSDHVV